MTPSRIEPATFRLVDSSRMVVSIQTIAQQNNFLCLCTTWYYYPRIA